MEGDQSLLSWTSELDTHLHLDQQNEIQMYTPVNHGDQNRDRLLNKGKSKKRSLMYFLAVYSFFRLYIDKGHWWQWLIIDWSKAIKVSRSLHGASFDHCCQVQASYSLS